MGNTQSSVQEWCTKEWRCCRLEAQSCAKSEGTNDIIHQSAMPNRHPARRSPAARSAPKGHQLRLRGAAARVGDARRGKAIACAVDQPEGRRQKEPLL